ncbi:MAG: PadR family transcriptional regulator [Oculatellaceae cyanobacterium Prado106]|jgi:DNA-binding PadR family transcriptional regulator|nr:PadR family transcriptional regulator [Oculatellaceae cyanobacterium Prado106]
MSLPHVILGFLQQQARTGYDLKNICFEQALSHLWSADQAQIYRSLDKLVTQGWVTCQIEIQHDRPNRKVYSVTETGRAELLRWLQESQPLPTIRDPLLAQLFFAACLPNEAIAHLLQQQLEAHQKQLEACDAIGAIPQPELSGREQQMHHLALELVKKREQAYIDGLRIAMKTLQ